MPEVKDAADPVDAEKFPGGVLGLDDPVGVEEQDVTRIQVDRFLLEIDLRQYPEDQPFRVQIAASRRLPFQEQRPVVSGVGVAEQSGL